MGDDRLLDALADAISEGSPVDWDAHEAAANDPVQRDLIRHLRAVAAVSRSARDLRPAGEARGRIVGAVLYRAVLACAAVKIAAALPGYGLRFASPGHPSLLPHIVILVTFGLAGLVLLWGGARDARARYLGALFLTVASSFANRGLVGFADVPSLAGAAVLLRGLTTEAFLAYALWAFVTVFPRVPERSLDVAFSRAFLRTSLIAGVVLLLANVTLKLPALGLLPLGTLWPLAVLNRAATDGVLFWPLQFAVAVPALPYLIWRSRFEASEDRQRVLTFAASLVAGVMPMLLVVMVSPFIPVLNEAGSRRWLSVVVDASLLWVVPSAVYSVLVRRVMDVRLIVTRRMQHAIARYGVRVLSVVPPIALAGYVYAHRDLAVTVLVSRMKSLALLPLFVFLGSVLASHQRILRAIDRRFLDHVPDYPRALAGLERQLRESSGVLEVAAVLASEVDRTIHPRVVTVLLPDEAGHDLVSSDGGLRPLPLAAPLCGMLARARQEIQVSANGSSALAHLLPDADRRWLAEGGVQLMVPLAGSHGRLVGALAIGEKRNEMPFSPDDRSLLVAMAGQAAITIENLRLRSFSPSDARAASREASGVIDWCDEPATVCTACLKVWPSSTSACRCGARTEPGALPLVVEGKFQLERVLGAGGMGVVYLAVDVALGRSVAIKTLPRLTVDRAVRLRQEARAMARVQHPNLATIHGFESWRDRPLLIVEYLEGGTLADRLLRERLSLQETVALGIVLADALDRVHRAGLLHRDIKPNNIAYAADGTPKLLDFGLASLVGDDGWAPAESSPDGDSFGALWSATSSEHHVKGTLAYLSPEAVSGQEPDSSFDLWSLCLVLYECTAGVHPLAARIRDGIVDSVLRDTVPDIRQYRPDCPASVAAFFHDALAVSRDRRPPTAADLRERCQRLRATLNADRE